MKLPAWTSSSIPVGMVDWRERRTWMAGVLPKERINPGRWEAGTSSSAVRRAVISMSRTSAASVLVVAE